MRKMLPIAAVLASAVLVSGCGSSGLNRDRPDEFAVSRQAPLVIPPDYSLVPPRPGAARAGATASDQALEALFGGPAQRSAAESATLDQADRGVAQQGIRSAAGSTDTNVVDKSNTTRDIVAAPEGDGRDASASTPQ
ncbi:DUF3035 domain-containing protein [Stakelama tenebrarum]|uniref:DUF3035 domain-containing protein n=1 Tax=Stakelama tenebrarum TaxID=2711215 RepID=A0A6G6Y1C8_9SPHN|nr:DUF3035 domain-containing protein [Sphingosinithalassobacter tenebrarum]QIG78413.1 DUF3035 domain-containing protein [Sphingosinithalassobacter tenebrarum]